MPASSKTQLAEITAKASCLKGEARTKYLSGLRDAADLTQVICDEQKRFSLAADKTFHELLDFLDAAD